MSNPVILSANALSKQYSLNSQKTKSRVFKDIFRSSLGLTIQAAESTESFWALKDVFLELKQGESLALLGKNGSGKSTLLKMLANLIVPTSGHVECNGSIQALINLGAGFDRKLTGRENIINSCLLSGFTLNDAKSAVSPILEFSGLGDFIDAPVGTYSSGMHARLGFSVATHAKPDIILIDEILSVGDVAFQNKCLSKMQDLRKDGVAMVLVSHSHAQISQFCDQAIWLNEGEIKAKGFAKEILKDYLAFMESNKYDNVRAIKTNASNSDLVSYSESGLYGVVYNELGLISDYKIELVNEQSVLENEFFPHERVQIQYGFKLKKYVDDLNVTLNIYRQEDGFKITTITTLNGDLLSGINEGTLSCTCNIESLNLVPGQYVITTSIHEGSSYLYRDVVKIFRVKSSKNLTWGLLDMKADYVSIENA